MSGTQGGDVPPTTIEDTAEDPFEDTIDHTIEDVILRQLEASAPDATVCPSEVARALAGSGGDWRTLMPRVRQVAQRMAERGALCVTRRGVQVDANLPGGPIRLGRPTKANAGPRG